MRETAGLYPAQDARETFHLVRCPIHQETIYDKLVSLSPEKFTETATTGCESLDVQIVEVVLVIKYLSLIHI